jgi:DNA-binding LacI/PurR family transcriptional regulator
LQIIDAVAKQRIPCALLNDNSSQIRVNELRLPSTLKVFRAAAVEAGKEMGRHLLRQGHRNIAYVSPFHGRQWSLDRLAGLEDAARKSGRSGEIRRFVSVDYADAHQDLGSQIFFPTSMKGTKEAEKKLSANGGSSMLKRLFELDHTSSGFTFLSGLSTLLRPALVDICNNREITAVVAANDTVALVIEDFILQEHLSIPGRFALAGFDDTSIAFEYDITSYNFDFTSLAHRALSYVLYPKQFSRSMPDRVIECPGILMRRGSTRAFLA